MFTESDCVARFGIAKISTGIFTFKHGRVEDMGTGVFDRWEGGGFVCDSSEDMERLGGLKDARLRLIMSGHWQMVSSLRTSEAERGRDASMKEWIMG